jgi:PAS domain S-box-containing protein
VADAVAVGICVVRAADGAVVYANDAAAAIAGDADAIAELPHGSAVRARVPITVEGVAARGRRGLTVHAHPLFGAGGEVTHVVSTIVDASVAHPGLADRVRAAEDRLHHVLSSAPVVLFAFDMSGRVTLSEGRGLKALGYEPKALVGESVYELFKRDPVAQEHTRRALAGESFTVSWRGGGDTALETTFSPLYGTSGELEGTIGVGVDVSDRVKIQSRLVQAERLASMGTLSATIAHEINNPLTYILVNLDLLANGLAALESPVARTMASRVSQAREGADRVRRIVRGLQAFARQDDDDRATPIDVRAALERSIELSDNVVRHRARLVRELSDVPPVLASDLRLGQVFMNLLVNAAQAIPEGRADENEIRVATTYDEARRVVIVSVADTGTGIAPEIRTRIFEPFFTTKPAGVGTGLGLAICNGIVEGFGGTIDVESTPGRGAIFRVGLPAYVRIKEDAVAPVPAPPAARRGRILVVDDDASVARSLSLLMSEQHEVVIVTRAKEAARLLAVGEPFDLIFCDLMMPEMTGMDFYEAVRALPGQANDRIVFVTGGAFTAAARDFKARVPNTFLEKPFDERALAAILAARLGPPAP